MKTKPTPQTIDEYIQNQPPTIQPLLEQLRHTIHKAAPNAKQTISYGMPAFKQNHILVYFAAFKNHIGFYPTASGVEAFKPQLTAYKTSKGAIQFPLDQPLPIDLISEIVVFRAKEDQTKT